MKALEFIEGRGIVPVINIEKKQHAIPLAQALIDGGIPLIEVTLRNDTSLESIASIRKAFPHITIAAGTVLSSAAAKEAEAAGADIIVTPGFQRKTVEYCLEEGIPIIPGCVTATEIAEAADMGLKCLKFFPAEQSGGVKALELLGGPFPEMKFIPTGGLNFHNLSGYLSCRKVMACGGSYMADAATVRKEEWETITANCRRAVEMSLGFQLAHIGINHADEEAAVRTAEAFGRILKIPVVQKNSSIFSGTWIESMKQMYIGEKGHIGIHTHSILRTMNYLQELGIAFREEGRKYDKSGNLSCVYMKEEIAGFGIHFIQ